MSYDQTKKFDKNPDRFGTGDPEGVCAAECANNATVAPALIPLLTLSIPGSPTAAVLLGGEFIAQYEVVSVHRVNNAFADLL